MRCYPAKSLYEPPQSRYEREIRSLSANGAVILKPIGDKAQGNLTVKFFRKIPLNALARLGLSDT
jgi:hypothetical protein